MKASVVLDASVALAWCFDDEATEGTQQLLERMVDEAVAVPPLWFLEVSNVLVLAERKKRITPAEVYEFVELLKTLAIEVDDAEPGRAFDQYIPLGRQLTLSIYDTAYLDLAMRLKLPLGTLDLNLQAAAETMGVEIFNAAGK